MPKMTVWRLETQKEIAWGRGASSVETDVEDSLCSGEHILKITGLDIEFLKSLSGASNRISNLSWFKQKRRLC